MIAKNNNAHNSLAEQLKEHSITREYEFICHGVVKEDKITVNKPLGRNPKDRLKMAIVKDGKRAVTHFEVIERFENYTLEGKLRNRKNSSNKSSCIIYKSSFIGRSSFMDLKIINLNIGQTLHAKKLGFIHPSN